MAGVNIQVDAAPEFRLQALRHRIPKVDLVILTHGHSDHILGMDDLRRYCDMRSGAALPVYTNEEGQERMRSIFGYSGPGTYPLTGADPLITNTASYTETDISNPMKGFGVLKSIFHAQESNHLLVSPFF